MGESTGGRETHAARGDDRRTGGGGQEHGRAAAGRAGSAGGSSTPARCTGPSPWRPCGRDRPDERRGPRRARRRGLASSLPPGRVLLDGEDVTQSDPERRGDPGLAVSSPTARASAAGSVDWQRDFAAEHDVVTEGRDQGTIVFPDAFRKFYLTASDEERARRRLAEYRARGESVSFESVLRDHRASATPATPPARSPR